jgi:hypothetical protein
MPPPNDHDRRLARREKPVSGQVEDYNPGGGDELDEGPSEADVARFGDVTIKCPECGTELYDDVALCWKCGRAVGPGAAEDRKGPPVWMMVVVVVLVCLMAFWITRGVF